MPTKHFESFAADAEETGALDNPVLRRSFMLTLAPELPLTTLENEWLNVANRYALGRATETELEKARVAAWESLGKRSCEFADPAVNRTRAVICTLFPYPTPDGALDEVLAFSEFFIDAGGSEERAVEVLASLLTRG